MWESIGQYAEGNWNVEIPEITFSISKIEEKIPAGSNFSGSFHIESVNGLEIKGSVETTSFRMKCRNREFSGKEAEILYDFYGCGLSPEQEVKGELQIVSNGGEYLIPFQITAERNYPKSSMGMIKNLFHFTNLAKSSWGEAKKVFYQKEFETVFHKSDWQFLEIYKGLAAAPQSDSKLEEFLTTIHKKEKVKIDIQSKGAVYKELTASVREHITVSKSQWGYTEIRVLDHSDFISIKKEVLTADDFIGAICPFEYVVDYDKLHAGRNFGCLIFCTVDQKFTYTVEAEKLSESIPEGIAERREKRDTEIRLARMYYSYRAKKMNQKVWAKESMKLLRRLLQIEPDNPFYLLLQVQVFIADKKTGEARQILENKMVFKRIKKSELDSYAYYLYLNAKISGKLSVIDKAAQEVFKLYQKDKMNWKYIWLLCYMDEAMTANPERKYEFLMEYLRQGCANPIIYLEPVQLWNQNPVLLSQLGKTEQRILYWAGKYNLIGEALASQIIYLAGKLKNYEERIELILEKCYLKFQLREALKAICSLLIKGEKTESRYFKWYELGVRYDLHITRLFEYFMMSIDRRYEKPLPKMVFMYFQYNSNLRYDKKAVLYVNLLRNKEACLELYQSYQEQMRTFAADCLRAGYINDDMVPVYKELLPEMLSEEELRKCAARLLVTYKLECSNKEVVQVIVRHEQLEQEECYPLHQGVAYIKIYTSEYQILLEDRYKNRYAGRIPYDLTKMFRDTGKIETCFRFENNQVEILLHLCAGKMRTIEIDEKNLPAVNRIIASPDVCESFKKDMRLKIIDYYFDRGETSLLNAYLLSVPFDMLFSDTRDRIVEYLIIQRLYDTAYSVICKFGYERMNFKLLLKLCSFETEDLEGEADWFLVHLCSFIFHHGKYNEDILSYLQKNEKGSTKALRNIWKAASQFGLDVYELEERLIIQMLFCNTYIGERNDIFLSYCRQGAKATVEKAYLNYYAYGYFIKGRIVEEELLEQMERLYQQKEELAMVCRISLLKYYSEKESMTEKEEEIARELLKKFTKEHIYFEFFKKFSYDIQFACHIHDKTIIEYATDPKNRVILHYILENEENKEPVYRQEEMENVFEGVFSRTFVLMVGDRLQYYISEQKPSGEESITESKEVDIGNRELDGRENKFDSLNDMLLCISLQDEQTLLQLMQDYMEEEFLAERLFTVKE